MTSELTVDGSSDAGAERPALSKDLRRYHLGVLLASLGVLAAAFLLQVRSDQRVQLSVLPDWPAPEVCYSRALFGWNCPGCGLTRSFVYLAAGDVNASLEVNRVGWLFAVVVALQIPYRLWAIISADGCPLGRRVPWLFVWIPFALLIANWIANLVSLAY